MPAQKNVFILGNASDEHAMHVFEQLAARGARVEWLDGQAFPQDLQVAFEPGTSGHLVLPGEEKAVHFDDIESVYWRNYFGSSYPDLPNAEQAELAASDTRCLFDSLLIEMPTRWVNGWNGFQIHQTKPAALARIKRLNLEPVVRIPATLHTNDPIAVREFVAEVGGCIYKPVQGGAHTRRLQDEHLTEEHLQVLQYAPVTIQQEIPGHDVRVFVAGERILACVLLTDKLDFRDDADPQIQMIEISDDLAEACLKIANSLELVWTGIDFRMTPDGEFYYFEANPSPMFLGFEYRCGLPLTEALVDLLLGTTV